MHATPDLRQPRPLPTGWKHWIILTAFVAAGFLFGVPTYLMLALFSSGLLSFYAVIWALYIGLVLSLIAIATVVLRYRKRRCGAYVLAFIIGLSLFFAYGSFSVALGRL